MSDFDGSNGSGNGSDNGSGNAQERLKLRRFDSEEGEVTLNHWDVTEHLRRQSEKFKVLKIKENRRRKQKIRSAA